jgi:hypothetical protein
MKQAPLSSHQNSYVFTPDFYDWKQQHTNELQYSPRCSDEWRDLMTSINCRFEATLIQQLNTKLKH